MKSNMIGLRMQNRKSTIGYLRTKISRSSLRLVVITLPGKRSKILLQFLSKVCCCCCIRMTQIFMYYGYIMKHTCVYSFSFFHDYVPMKSKDVPVSCNECIVQSQFFFIPCQYLSGTAYQPQMESW